VGLRSVLDAVVKRKIPSSCRESNLRTPIVRNNGKIRNNEGEKEELERRID
jgi:hypothetical protein